MIRAGECFGEIAFLHGVPRTVDVVARAPGVLLLALNESVLRSLLRDDPEIAARVLLNTARGLALKLCQAGCRGNTSKVIELGIFRRRLQSGSQRPR